MDVEVAGRSSGGIGIGRFDQPRSRAANVKKNIVKPWLTQSWCLPKEHDAEFVWRMEDVLDVYARPYDPRFPVICMDEASKQLVGEVRAPLPMRPGDPLRIDSEYVRLGTCNLFMFCEPLRGRRHVRVTDRRTKVDWAYALRDFLREFYAEAEKIVLVMDNLNTHSPGSFYEAFDPQVARELTERLEIHYTPKHGSWLNIAECEFSVLQRQCLDRRIENALLLGSEVNAWQDARNAIDSKINWQFTTDNARTKLRRLYPEYLRLDNGQDSPTPTKVHN